MTRYIYNMSGDDKDRRRIQLIHSRVIEACDDFFRFISTAEPRDQHSEATLYSFFFVWIDSVYDQMEDDFKSLSSRFYMDPEFDYRATIWRPFLNMVPMIYVAIINEYLRDPSKLDLVVTDDETGEQTRIERRITSVLPDASGHIGEGYPPQLGLPDVDNNPPTDDELISAGIAHLIASASDTWPSLGYNTPPPSNIS